MMADHLDRWLDVLAGRREPDDPETRQAARARGILADRVRAEIDQPLDLVAQDRWLSELARVAAVERGHPAAPVAPPSTPSVESGGLASRPHRIWHRLVGAGWWSAMTGRVPVFAAGLLVLGVGALLVQSVPDPTPEFVEKRMDSGEVAQGDLRRVVSMRPVDDAGELRDALLAIGVRSQLIELGEATLLQIEPITEELALAVRQLLVARGIAAPTGSPVVIEYRLGSTR